MNTHSDGLQAQIHQESLGRFMMVSIMIIKRLILGCSTANTWDEAQPTLEIVGSIETHVGNSWGTARVWGGVAHLDLIPPL